MRSLLQCPNCEKIGRRNILGEIDPNGHFLVLRFHKGITRIIGDSFTVVCDYCNEPIYIRKGDNRGTVFSYRQQWAFGFAAGSEVGSTGAYGTAG